MMFMNILTLVSDRSYCLWLLRSAEADAQRHINKHTIFMWGIPVCGEYKLVQIIVNHTQLLHKRQILRIRNIL